MTMITYAISMIMLLISFMMIMVTFISKKSIVNNQKTTPFECGFNTMSYPRLPFSIHFFSIAVIFLIFDIEIILIMPMVMNYKSTLLYYWTVTSISFTLILIVGIYHEWKNGMINWTK